MIFKDKQSYDKGIKRLIFLESLEARDILSQAEMLELANLRVAEEMYNDEQAMKKQQENDQISMSMGYL
jgi:hypothetical protein